MTLMAMIDAWLEGELGGRLLFFLVFYRLTFLDPLTMLLAPVNQIVLVRVSYQYLFLLDHLLVEFVRLLINSRRSTRELLL